MPREYRMMSTEPIDLGVVVRAADEVDPGLRPRLLFGGWAAQLVDRQGIAVLTVEASRRLDDRSQADQLLGPPAGDPIAEPAADAAFVWWTEASAPWGVAGEPGSRLARIIAEAVGARLVAEEGQ
ncbi:hypothetical protein [Microlunatus sp. Gsoil 973]|uniref:hypothetical protein n=1 Tax=Microlunatus sp. Gsoil 973 TaxID=2672569 RepID=UPI0012B48631|nr:hypothetical protein [Microlunatus sp. Gsoil 973]QGN34636.1 hypothetical protein GJV80_19400 [Microlunatus sp. Gsoil 973]